MSNLPPDFQHGADPKAAAAAAKAYAKASRPWFKKKRFIIPLVLVGLFAVGSVTGSEEAVEDPEAGNSQVSNDGTKEAKSASSKKKAKPAPKAPEPKAVAVNAGALVEEFESNELAGDTKYKGKTLRISGVVAEIDTDMWDDDKYILRIGSGDEYEFLYVNCHDVDNDELASLSVGQNVTVIGQFDDGGDLGVEVNDCAVV